MENNGIIIQIRNLSKSYGKVHALENVSFDVKKGVILGLLGPNGAGKTTLVNILTTLLRPDGGTAMVSGFDVLANPSAVRSRIGLAGQFAAIDENLTGRENLELVGTLYHLPRAIAKKRAQKLLEEFSLTDAANRLAKTYSGGMRRRLDVASSLIGEPEILFLDEPTTGLDPQSRNELWTAIEGLVNRGTTVLLTTQYLEEADRLADHIIIMNEGKIVAQGTAKDLKSNLGKSVLEVHVKDRQKITTITTLLKQFDPSVNEAVEVVTIPITMGTQMLLEIIRQVELAGVELADIELRKPTLDEVFLTLTGKK
ncbi:MAG: daunorubicin/doxorubicin resistance ABC transporter ATP-binding protein DrrA [Candidatus Taylorbacteria bacterium RIFCSPHIGHO2_02_FULL_46_13]|uniref:Daunorubicin/doxorubicin resistance ABC transporter ATP-binding protein DrrA n=2 Tax=Parcubacteria group TaxID=1794811 RepID=A0A1G2HTM7_9BACT|nr:MAG: daunorubicin/doxorubicin resistance ABC transporter ATP-binding protein DrrA [Candidatus Staskawiczbacteria bacterium RIFCSPHIGHO2_01_FULL_41_41]OGZ75021.1 MAG: daunorubicin/doxorubicin resistance ABC transporter ATP-binding protein DrrA [Candidatus Staskawiczbacteria bacterium RIFCSPLOWO2_01_FULL_43_17b]OHA26068.1 MAG: daunorubicin/doxorubicin resistance ABC transporter ATP-binding protein DrrA [Candidatus Taylorbacteria bacterium RIFCSPHIGHO2_02_FULL_46_13]